MRKSKHFATLPGLNKKAHYVLEQHSTGDWFQEYFATQDDALAYADYKWSLLTKYEKNHTTAFYVAKIKFNGDEEAPDYDFVEMVKDYCKM